MSPLTPETALSHPSTQLELCIVQSQGSRMTPSYLNCVVTKSPYPPVTCTRLISWIIMHHLRLGAFGLMSSSHEWIAGAGTISSHGEMIEEESIIKYTLVANLTRLLIKRKWKDTILRPLSKTRNHWRLPITKECRGVKERYFMSTLSSQQQQWLDIAISSSSPCQQCHVMSCHEWSCCHITIIYHVHSNQMYCKVEAQRTHMHIKSHVIWKLLGSQTVMRVGKESPLVIYTPSLYEERTFPPWLHQQSNRENI